MADPSTPHIDECDLVFQGIPQDPSNLISILQRCQEQFGYISPEHARRIAAYLGVSEARVYGVASFYTQFRFQKPGEHKIRVCLGTACHVQDGKQLSRELVKQLGIKPGQTTPDGRFDFEEVACLGCCALAPVVEIDGKIYAKMTREKLRKVLASYA